MDWDEGMYAISTDRSLGRIVVLICRGREDPMMGNTAMAILRWTTGNKVTYDSCACEFEGAGPESGCLRYGGGIFV